MQHGPAQMGDPGCCVVREVGLGYLLSGLFLRGRDAGLVAWWRRTLAALEVTRRPPSEQHPALPARGECTVDG